jgi:hypothetical protein
MIPHEVTQPAELALVLWILGLFVLILCHCHCCEGFGVENIFQIHKIDSQNFDQ